MSLQFALLGFLSTEPASGYTIAQEFSESMAWFWHASHSQIYPELRRLDEEGLVRSRPPREPGGRTKRVYEITPAGRRALREWLQEDVDYPPVRDPERTKLIYLDDLPIPVIRRHLTRHREHHAGFLRIYERELRLNHAGTHRRLVKRLAARSEDQHEVIRGLKILALQGLVDRARSEIAWAEDGLAWLARFGDASDRADPDHEEAS